MNRNLLVDRRRVSLLKLPNASQKRNVLYDVNAEFDFTAGSLHPERLKEYGMNEYALNLVEKGIPVNLSHPLFVSSFKASLL